MNLLQKFDQNYYLFGPNMIQKIILATNNEQKSQNWLNLDETAGQDLIDVWIDGAIWLSDANLGLRQYLRGAQVTTKIANDLLPPLYLTKKDDDFFVLSGSQGTITRFDAKGEAIQTWSDPILQDSRWLWFDPEENTLFVFKDNLLYNLKVN